MQNFLDQDLSEQDAITAELLDWWLTGQIEMEDFYYFQEPLGPTLGVQAQLPVLLAEFAFRKEADVDLYLDLLKQLPDYFTQIIDFEREKASHGMFLNGESLDQILALLQRTLQKAGGERGFRPLGLHGHFHRNGTA